MVEAGAATGTEFCEAAGRFAHDLGAVFAGDVEAQPAIELIADAEAENRRVLYFLLVDGPACRPDERGIRLAMIERLEVLDADPDVTAQIPAARLDDRRMRRLIHHWRRRGQIGGEGGGAD